MTKKMPFYIIACFCLLLFTTIVVYADGGSAGDYNGGANTSYDDGSGATTWSSVGAGIRISYVTSTGQHIQSKDYYTGGVSAYQVKATGTKYSRVVYQKTGTSVNFSQITTVGQIAEPLDNLIRIIDSSAFSGRIRLEQAVTNFSYAGIFDALKPANNTNNPNYSKDVMDFFKSFSGLSEQYLSSNDLFMVFEPISMAKINGSRYYGTSYELAVIAANSKAGGFVKNDGTVPCAGSPNGALCDLGSVLSRTLPCASYLTGTLYDEMKAIMGTNISPSDAAILNRFSKDSYFGGAIKRIGTASSTCSKTQSTFAKSDMTSASSGLGMGIVWVGEFLPKANCSSILEGITWDWKSAFEGYFKNGGVQGIYNAFHNSDSTYPYGYIAYSGGQKADLKWFVNECTCYGIYEYYANSRLTAYTQSNINTINNISNKFGSKNWYTAAPIYVTKGWLVGAKADSGTFKDFDTQNEKYAKEHGLTSTPVTKDKYVTTLQCGTKEDYWCDDFDAWYTQTVKSYSRLRSYPSISTIKNSSISVINSRYKDQLQTMLSAYNVMNYPAMGFVWTMDLADKKTGSTEYSYIMHCTKNANEASCDDIKNFYPDLNGKSCESLTNYNFSQFNKKYNKNVTGEWYVANCGCTKPVAYNCTPTYNLGTCITGDSLNYKDAGNGVASDEYWKNCVFDDNGSYEIDVHKESNKNAALTYYEKDLGSRYCEVYCIEQVTANFSRANVNVEAGSRFYWGDSTVRGGRTCKTKTVEWDQFDADLKQANQEIRDAYVAWQLEIKKAAAIRNHSTKKSSSSCDCVYNTSHNSCCRSEKSVKHTGSYPSCYSCSGSGKTRKCGYHCTRHYTYYTYPCTRTDNKRYDRYDAKAQSFSIVQGEHDSWPGTWWCSNQATPSTNVSGLKSTYETKIKNAQKIVTDMKSCYTWDKDTIYEVDPEASLTYSDNKNYNYSDKLLADTSYYGITDNLSKCLNTNVNQVQSCSGTSCPNTKVAMKNCKKSGVSMERTSRTVFSLDDDVYRYVLKSNNLSIHRNDLSKYKQDGLTTNYYDMHESNLPVSYSAPNGKYGSMHGRGQLDVTYSKLGHIQNNRTMVDTILSSNTAAGAFGKWECQFTVYSDFIPCEKGDNHCPNTSGDITVVYRTIDLNNPFPDIDGSKRNTGSNWCDRDSCKSSNRTVQNYILNNRGVTGNDIYNQEPMYTFTLTPTAIRNIRNYNAENSYTSYTGSIGTARALDFVCTTGKSINCRSEFIDYLTEIMNENGKLLYDGTCMKSNYRTSMTVDNTRFNACR